MKGFMRFLGAAALIGVGVHVVRKYFEPSAARASCREATIAKRSGAFSLNEPQSDTADIEGDVIVSETEPGKRAGIKTESRVSVTRTDEEGRNTHFRDNETGQELTREQFVKKIGDGTYNDYYVRQINGVDTPVSKPVTENLG